MRAKVSVHEPMRELENGRWYLRVKLDDARATEIRAMHDARKHRLLKSVIDDPLVGNVLTVKVPFRYRRVTCEVKGSKPLQALERGDECELDLEFCGTWNLGEHCGYAWKILSAHT